MTRTSTKGLLQEERGQRLHAAHGHGSGVVGAREAMTTNLSADVSEQIEIGDAQAASCR
jgi:hypothetical protein